MFSEHVCALQACLCLQRLKFRARLLPFAGSIRVPTGVAGQRGVADFGQGGPVGRRANRIVRQLERAYLRTTLPVVCCRPELYGIRSDNAPDGVVQISATASGTDSPTKENR